MAGRRRRQRRRRLRPRVTALGHCQTRTRASDFKPETWSHGSVSVLVPGATAIRVLLGVDKPEQTSNSSLVRHGLSLAKLFQLLLLILRNVALAPRRPVGICYASHCNGD